MQAVFAIGAMLVICVAMSTRESRAAGREMVKPFARLAGVLTAAFWVWAIWLQMTTRH